MSSTTDSPSARETKDKIKHFEKVNASCKPEDMMKQRAKAKFNERFYKFENPDQVGAGAGAGSGSGPASLPAAGDKKESDVMARARRFAETAAAERREKEAKEAKERREGFEKNKGMFSSVDGVVDAAKQNISEEEEREAEEQQKEEEKIKKREEFKAKTKMFMSLNNE